MLHVTCLPAFAQDWDARQGTPESLGEALDAPGVNLEKMGTYQTLQVIPGALTCGLIGLGCTAKEEETGMYQQKSVVGLTGNLIAGMYANPPASFSYYAYDVLQNLGLAPKAYAQGIGFSGLTPILPLWKAFRNIAYMLLVVVLIVIGFMIMFRMKINPQTVISIQNALPRIAVTLLLITFSYAIAGFLIDLMYLAIMLVIVVFGQSGMVKDVAAVQQSYLTGGLPDLFGAVFGAGLRSVDDLAKALVGDPQIIQKFIGSGVLGLIIGLIQGLGFLVTGFIFGVLIAFALLFSFVRIFLTLLSSYIQIILSVIFSPFQIVFDAIPGRGGFSGWLKGLIANLLVFPATAALLLLGMTLTTSNPDALWTPPFLIRSAGNAMAGLIGLGLVLLLPTLLNKIKEMFAAKPGLPIGLGMVMGPALGGAMKGFQLFSQYAMLTGAMDRTLTLKPRHPVSKTKTPGGGAGTAP